jgi:hypothetical protein
MRQINDHFIRYSFIDKFIAHSPEYSWNEDILVSEMGLSHGASRIDLAIINGSLHGYEIKSDVDTLVRLENQIDMYEKYFSYLTVVTTKKHLSAIRKSYPSWLGIVLAESEGESLNFKTLRKPKKNCRVLSSSVVQLLWKNEAQEFVRKIGVQKGISNKPKNYLWEKICEVADLPEITAYLKVSIKKRAAWQVIQPQP